MRWAGHVAHMGEERGVYTVLLGKPGERRPLGRSRRKCYYYYYYYYYYYSMASPILVGP